MTINDRVLEYIKLNNMIPRGSSVVVGLSGGPDSVCLLFLLLEYSRILNFSLKAIHVEHGIRGEEAYADQRFCEELCKRTGTELEVIHADIPRIAAERGLSLEEAGRLVRYEAFEGSGADRIAVAHHASDQAETVLFNMFRGSAVAGLGGMKPVRGRIIRPLLCVSRSEIIEFLQKNSIEYCIDRTNYDNDIARNSIRNELIPLAEKINSGAVRHINESAGFIRMADAFISEEALRRMPSFAKRMEGRFEIDTKIFMNEDPVIRTYIIRECIKGLSGKLKDITSQHAVSVEELARGSSGRKIMLPYGITAEKCFDSLVLSVGEGKAEEAGGAFPEYEVPAEGEVVLPDGSVFSFSFDSETLSEELIKDHAYTKWFDYDKIVGKICMRTRRSGDVISIRGGTKKVKELLIEAKIPAGERGSIYMLCEGNRVIWIPGLRIGEEYKVSENTKKIWKAERKQYGRQG